MTADEILAGLFTEAAREDPYPRYAALRALGPVCALAQRAAGVTPFAAVATGYDIVDQVLRDPSFYKKGRPDWRDHPLLTTFETSMMFNNPPDHHRMRQVFQRTFSPRRLAALEPIVERVTDDLLARMTDLGAGGAEFDFIAEFAYPMPARAMATFLGIPEEDLDWYRARVHPIDAYLDIDGKTPQRLQAANEATSELRDFYADLIASRRREPHDDLISALVEAVDAENPQVSEPELISNLVVLFNASFLTTIFLLGSGIPLLLSRPDVVAALPGNPDLAHNCVHEILRCESPVQFLTRAASVDTELGRVAVPAHGVVLLLVAAANRDPERFEDPDVFEPARADSRSLAFGAGVHFCLGAAVALIEGRIALPRLFARFPQLSIAGTPVRTGSVFLRGLSALPVAVG